MRSLFKRITCTFLAAALSASLLCVNTSAVEKKEFESAKQAAANMHAGINLACNLDSFDDTADQYSCSGVNPQWKDWGPGDSYMQGTDPLIYETAWGNPPISEKYIKAIKNAGYNAIRLDVTWGIHSDKNGNIRKDWLDRVQEVVDMILAEDMYCLLTSMHDSGDIGNWIQATEENYSKNKKRVANIWKNIAVRFRDYDEKLLFDAFNEMNSPKKDEKYIDDNIRVNNKWLQLFVDSVRETGGNNKYRNLCVNTYQSNNRTNEGFVMPNDPAENHLIIESHYYLPLLFTFAQEDEWISKENLTVSSKWGSDEEKKDIENDMNALGELSEKWNAPVIIGEFGCAYKNDSKYDVKWTECVVKNAANHGIVCFCHDDATLLDINTVFSYNISQKEKNHSFGLFNRIEGKPVRTDIINAHIITAYKGKLPAPKLTAKKKGNSVTLKWEGLSAAYGYRIYELDAGTKKYKEIAYLKGTRKEITGLSKGSHTYVIAPVAKYEGKSVNGSYSNAVRITV